jgi:hypothetical protein
MTLVRLAGCALVAAGLVAAQSLDFETYRTKVEPIFVKKRSGHARCVACHEASNNAFKLEPRAPGATSWTEEQSRKNYETVSRLVKPGDPARSILLHHPLAKDAGGDLFHSGGRQFTSQEDPDYVTVAQWIKQGK